MEDLAKPPSARRGNVRSNLPLLNIPSPRAGEGGYDPSGFEAYEDDPQDEQGGNTSPPPQVQSNPNPPLRSVFLVKPGNIPDFGVQCWGNGVVHRRGGTSNSLHESFNKANEGGLNSPPPVFASRVYNPSDRRAILDLPDDLYHLH